MRTAAGYRPKSKRAVLRLVVLVLLVFVLPATVTLNLKLLGERGLHAERDLQAVATELQVQDGLEWRAISGRGRLSELREGLAASRERTSGLLSQAHQNGVSAADTGRMAEVHRGYGRVVDQELELLEAGDFAEAAEFDEQQVDPRFERANEALAELTGRVSARANRASLLSDVGVLVTVLLSVALTTVVQGRRKRAELRQQAERRSEARYRALIDQSADLVMVVDRAGVARFLSPSAERLLGSPDRTGAETKENPAVVDLLGVVHPDDHAHLLAALNDDTGVTVAPFEVRITTDHDVRTFEVSVQDLTGQPSVQGIVLTARDVTDRLVLQREMERRALHDTLTGLPNRALLADRFGQALLGAQRDGTATGLLLIDLDRFKEINDTFGHHYGDALLTQIGPRLSAALRKVDTIARLGGDEFAVLLPDVSDVQSITAVALKLQAALQAPFEVEGVDLDVEASIGLVLSGEHGDDVTTLLQRADIAMYVAKTQNLGVFAYDPTVDGHSPAKLALLGDLRRALERGELILHYQPKISISTGEVVGAEALVRWQHPDRGLLFPDTFIPLAERTGLIGPLTHYVLSGALAQARRWADAGQPLKMSVNLSARNLLDERLPAQIAELLTEHGVPAERLELEVTESAIMSEPVRAQRLLKALSALGIRLSIDDFGAGYTSLGQLKTLPVTELKIDKSFVMTMAEDHSNALIVHSVVELGHNLGLTLVAEGVETAHALTALAEYGCDVAQGYYLCRPITATAFDVWRDERRAAVQPDHTPPPPRRQVPHQPPALTVQS